MEKLTTTTIYHHLVTHPTITNYTWIRHQTPMSSPLFLTLTITTYLTLTFLLHRLNLTLPTLLLRPITTLHNLILTLLSLLMSISTILSTLHQSQSPTWPICFPPHQPPSGPTFFWAHIFYFSKILEFLDTALILVSGSESRSRRLSFLHVYHHAVVVVMCYVWIDVAQSLLPVALVTNATVHVLMYGYYFLCGIGIRPKWKRVVTDCQIVQFVFSFLVSGVMLYLHFTNGVGCNGIWGWCFNAGFNASLLWLFLDFHSNNYAATKKKKKLELSGGEDDGKKSS